MRSLRLRRVLGAVAVAAALTTPAVASTFAPVLTMAEHQETEGPREPPVKGLAVVETGAETGSEDDATADRRIIVYS